MDDDPAPPAPVQGDQATVTQVTILVGYAQLLRRRLARMPDLPPATQHTLLRELTHMEQAAWRVLRGPTSPLSPRDEP